MTYTDYCQETDGAYNDRTANNLTSRQMIKRVVDISLTLLGTIENHGKKW